MATKLLTMIFPYAPRPGQSDIVDLVRGAVSEGGTAVFESGTGTGKTVCSLTGALEGMPPGKKIVYLTRTKSQHRQVIQECRRISEHRDTVCMGMQGRNVSTCPFMKEDPELAGGTPEELSRLCSDLKKNGGCRYYRVMDADELSRHAEYLRKDHPDTEELISYAASENACPYELMKALLPGADVVVAPYAFMLMPGVRRHFLNWMNVRMDGIVIIADEAHNIPDYLREVMTAHHSENSVRMTLKESSEWDDPEVHGGIRVSTVASALGSCMSEAVAEYLAEDDGLVPPYFLEEGMMSALGVSSVTLDKIYKALIEIGETVAERKKKEKKLPRSYIGAMGRFLQMWTGCDEGMFVKLVSAPPNASFESYCMDPYVAAEPFRDCFASVHMSGTLQPLDRYVQMLGLDGAASGVFPSPFDPDDLTVIYAEDASTKFDDMMADPSNLTRLENHTVDIVTAMEANSAVFFPSYSMMDRFIEDGIPERCRKDVYYEKKGAEQTELMEEIERFRGSDNAVLFAVAGGRVSEGIDFPDRDLELAVIVGIPYPKPTAKLAALTRYCDIRYGDGWGQAVRSPTVRKMRQAIGRLIRSETDIGAAVILDRRTATIRELDAKASADPRKDVIAFFDRKRSDRKQ